MSTAAWEWLYKIAADLPETPGPKTQRIYTEFYRGLRTVIPDEHERRAYKRITSAGPFKLTGDTFAKGPLQALQWITDVHNGVLLSLGRAPTVNYQNQWKKLKYARSTRSNTNENANENLNSTVLKNHAHLEKLVRSGPLTVVLFDSPHFLYLIPRRNTKAHARLAEFKARFPGVVTAVVPGTLSFGYYFAKPFTNEWTLRVSKFPWFRVYKDGKVITESGDAEDVRRFLKQRQMRDQPVQYVSQNSGYRKTPKGPPGVGRTFAHGVAKGFGQSVGRGGVLGALL